MDQARLGRCFGDHWIKFTSIGASLCYVLPVTRQECRWIGARREICSLCYVILIAVSYNER